MARRSGGAGSRIARLHASHSYGFVLVLVLAAFVFVMAAPEVTWARVVFAALICATLAVAIWTSGLGWGARAILAAMTLAALAAAIAVVIRTLSDETGAGVVFVIAAALTLAVIVVIAVGVLDQREVNAQSVVGAICIYLLLGLMFSFAYGAAAKLGSGDFFAQGTDGTPASRLYFSFMTMATVGNGDYTAAGDLGRTGAVVEALVGQLYLVTVIALLVSRLGLKRR